MTSSRSGAASGSVVKSSASARHKPLGSSTCPHRVPAVEMEAAKPAPDRWRTIARWLGESMTAMLLAEELIDQEEAVDSRGSSLRLRA